MGGHDRVCDVPGWLSVIPVGRGNALVLTGDSMQAAYYRWERAHYVLRWLYAESEDARRARALLRRQTDPWDYGQEVGNER